MALLLQALKEISCAAPAYNLQIAYDIPRLQRNFATAGGGESSDV